MFNYFLSAQNENQTLISSKRECGIRSTPFSHPRPLQSFAAQRSFLQWFALLWLVVVLAGHLPLLGIGLSTISAHPSSSDSPAAPALTTLHNSRRRREHMDGQDVPCASYSRYSTDNQREESITDQQRQCRERAASTNGHQISPELEYADEAISGTKLHRQGLDALLRDAEAGKFRVLYFYNLSRLARESVISMPILS
jgi:hypothetical protein